MKKIILFSVLVLALLVVGCEQIQRARNPLVGNWGFSVMGLEEIVTIQPDNTIYFSNALDGTRVFSYRIFDDKIELTNLDSGKVGNTSFKIIGDYKAIKIGDLTYYRYENKGEVK